MQIREVGVGTNADFMDEFVELQMYAPGQNLVQGHELRIYGANGDLDQSYPFPSSPTNGGDQRKILIGGTTAPGTPDFTEDLNINPAGGAVCFISSDVMIGAIDCVSWGTFVPGMVPPPSPTGANAAAIPESQSIDRGIAAGCPTALDPADDTNNSAANFAVQATPTPQNNTLTPTETVCVPPATFTPPGNPTSPINPAGNVRKRKCKKKQKSAAAAKRRCKKKKK